MRGNILRVLYQSFIIFLLITSSNQKLNYVKFQMHEVTCGELRDFSVPKKIIYSLQKGFIIFYWLDSPTLS